MQVTIADVLRARMLLKRYLPPTPMWSYPVLDEVAGARLRVKHENVQPTGAFKVRGGLTLLAGMPADERERGVVTWSTGNHAQSIAYAAQLFGVRCVVVMPEHASEVKVRAVLGYGATVALHGADLTEAREYGGKLADAEGMRPVSPAGDMALLAGVGTAYLEVFSAAPDLDLLVVPVGSGTGAAADRYHEQVDDARRVLAIYAHTLAEGAGAAALAAVLTHPQQFAGRRVGVMCTGGNASAAEIAALAPAGIG